MVELFRYYTVQLKAVYNTDADKFLVQSDDLGELWVHPTVGVTTEVKLIEIPYKDAGRVTVHEATDYGLVVIPINDDFTLGFYRLKVAQLKLLWDKYSKAAEESMASGDISILKAASSLRDKIHFLSEYECPVPGEMEVFEMPKPVTEQQEKWFTAIQTWIKNEETGRYDASGWRTESGEYLPDEAQLISIDGFVKIATERYGVMEVPAKATYMMPKVGEA